MAAYAVVLRENGGRTELLLSRLAPRITRAELWTLPGGGLEHGEEPRAALVREIYEEAGLAATVGDAAHVYSAHLPRSTRDGELVDFHALRIVYDAWVPADAPPPRVVEVDGSTVEVAWHPLADVLWGKVPVVAMVAEALRDHGPFRQQRVAAYAVVRRGFEARSARASTTGSSSGEVLLTRLSARAAHPGIWTLPGGGVDHGERPAVALAREVREECGLSCEVGALLDVHDIHFSGNAPSGRLEDYHGVHLLFDAAVGDGEPKVSEVDGTTDAAAWVPVAEIESGSVEVLDVVAHALRRFRDE